MVLQLLRSCVLVGLVGSPSLLVAHNTEFRPEIQVAMLNEAGVDSKAILLAKKIVSHTYDQAGFSIIWNNCRVRPQAQSGKCIQTVDSRHLVVSIEPRAQTLHDDVYGVAFLGDDGSGSYCDVFYDRIVELHNRGKAGLATILGIVAAHELGHLLLGSHSHSPVGLMRPQLEAKDFWTPELGRFTFSHQQEQTISRRVQRMMSPEQFANSVASELVRDSTCAFRP